MDESEAKYVFCDCPAHPANLKRKNLSRKKVKDVSEERNSLLIYPCRLSRIECAISYSHLPVHGNMSQALHRLKKYPFGFLRDRARHGHPVSCGTAGSRQRLEFPGREGGLFVFAAAKTRSL